MGEGYPAHVGEAGRVPRLPPSAPRVRGGAFARWLGRTVLRLGGWRLRMLPLPVWGHPVA